mmetsp:Transcript_16553/g.36085  ORF Transcript_16553/g.36085 Transcript_16553/m.36085 type:complete len:414 (-) Transcript_16553:19-1260(-)
MKQHHAHASTIVASSNIEKVATSAPSSFSDRESTSIRPVLPTSNTSTTSISDGKKESRNDNTDTSHDENNDVYRPPAGCTAIQIENPTDPAVDEKTGKLFAGWREVDASTIRVRGVGYCNSKKKKNKTKIESPGDLYRCVKADVFESQQQYPNMARRVVLPRVDFDDDNDDDNKTNNSSDQHQHQHRRIKKKWASPDVFVISVAIPTGGKKGNDGVGYTVTMYYTMQQETRDILRRITADGYVCDPESDSSSSSSSSNESNNSKVNAVRLLEKWCRRAPTDNNFMSRFKVIPRAENLEELRLPKWISKFNGKPFLVKRPGQTGFLYTHPEKSCMEFDVSLHPFPYLTRKGIRYMKDSYFKKTVATFAFCLEGREDDELPECVLGAFSLCYPDPVLAIQGEDLFAGTCHTSSIS